MKKTTKEDVVKAIKSEQPMTIGCTRPIVPPIIEKVFSTKDERDHRYVIANQEMKLAVWRRLGKLVGPVSVENDINNVLIELKELGEI